MDEAKKIVEDMDKDRRFAIDAIIVRIMKSRKVLGYQQLVAECVEQQARSFKVCDLAVSFRVFNLFDLMFCWWLMLVLLPSLFQPDFKQIKKRLEDLITRDYIERDTDDPQLFRYVAWVNNKYARLPQDDACAFRKLTFGPSQ